MKIGGDILYIYIIIGIIVILLIYILITYNSFINSRNLVKEAFSTMDIYLKKRWDLIPNLIEVVKGYSKYENETLTKITSLRSSSYDELTMDNKININEDLSRCLSNIFAVSENYPELKANELYTNLSNNLISIEDEIANSRKSQVGSGDRSEKIRTYNYPQGRITDHRIGMSVYQMENFLNGDIDEMIDNLIAADRAERLKGDE